MQVADWARFLTWFMLAPAAQNAQGGFQRGHDKLPLWHDDTHNICDPTPTLILRPFPLVFISLHKNLT